MLDELNEEAFMTAVVGLLKDPEEYERLSHLGKTFVKKHYSLKHTIDEMVKLYIETIEEKSLSRPEKKKKRKKKALNLPERFGKWFNLD